MNNKVTIITVTFNCEQILEETIKSCISQDYSNKEYIIIDGASTDGTIKIIKKYASYISYWKSEPDKGIYDAMNKGIEHSTGDWIIFMNAGDFFAAPNVLSRIFNNQKSLDSIGVIWGQNNTITNNGIFKDECNMPFWKQKSKYKNMGFNHQSVLVNLHILQKEKLYFDLSYKMTADYNMIYKLYNKSYPFHFVNFPISTIDGINGLSANNRRRQRYEEAKVCGCDKTLAFFFYTNYKSIRASIKSLLKYLRII